MLHSMDLSHFPQHLSISCRPRNAKNVAAEGAVCAASHVERAVVYEWEAEADANLLPASADA